MTQVVSTIERLLAWVDRYQRQHRRAGILYAVLKKYSEDESGHRAALMAYYGFLSIFPLLLVLATILRLLLHNNSELSSQILHSAVAYFPIIGRDLQQNIHGMTKTGLALVVGILLTLFGSRGVADVLRTGLDHIWQVPVAHRSTFWPALGRSMSIIIVGGLGLMLGPFLAGYAVAVGHGVVFGALSIVVMFIILFSVLIFVIKVGSSAARPLKEIWLGAGLAAAGMTLLQSSGSFILARELQNLDDLYGTFALVLGLIFWIYLQTQLLLLALELDSVRVLRLWPRSLQKPLTAADHRAYQLYGDRARFHDLQDD